MKVPEGGAKRKLLDAAEALVAGKGFDSVSVRDITGAASANVAAVNYHFGSREGLMDLVAARILEPLCAERARALENNGRPSADSLVRSFVAALSTVAGETGMDGGIFPRLAGRVLSLPDDSLPPVLASARREVRGRYLEAISRVSEVKEADLDFFEAGIAQSLIGVPDVGRMAGLLEDWIAFGVRGFAAAGSPKKKVEDPQGLLFDF